MGFLPKNKVIPLIRGSFALLQPSFAEGISTTILEAMACKIPIIASNLGGNKELVIDNENGFLIDPQNINEMNEKITELSENKSCIPRHIPIITPFFS